MDPPQAADRLGPGWLTTRLREVGVIRDARITSIEVTSVGEFGMTGEVSRLSLGYDRQEIGAPASLVAKFAATDPTTRATVHSMGFYEREVNFYTQLALGSPVHTPRCYLAWVDMVSGASLLLLEDLSYLTPLSSQRGLSIAETEVVLDEIAALHAAWWTSERLPGLEWLRLRGMAANDQVAAAFEQQWDSFLSKLDVPLTPEILDLGRYAGRYLPHVSEQLYGAAPTTLVHNDLQGNNVLLGRDAPSAILLDWQLATIGRGPVDVGYFLGGSLHRADRRIAWDRLVTTYHSQLVERGVGGYSLEQCQIDCRLAVLPAATRLATAVGFIPNLRATPGSFWDDVFPRYASALSDLSVADLCAEQFD